ncbi:MAG: hypothetical protein DDT18_01663 [Actinobacteria bacterium]|nr:hypothetical protein [Actinomycetota bacterium]
MKKTLIIISVVLGVLAMAVGIYFAWKKSRELLAPPVIDQRLITDDQRLPDLAEKKIKILSDQPIFDYWVFATSTKQVFYLNQDGQIFKVKEDAEDEAITPEPIDNLQSVKSSFDGKLALIKFGPSTSSGQGSQFLIFNSETKVQEFLPENITAAAFSPDAKKIIYLQKQVGFKTASDLIIRELTGAKPKTSKILSFNQMDFDLDWILPETVILTPKPSAFSAVSAWNVDIKNKTFKPLWPIDLSGLMINWSIDGRTDGKLGLQFNSGKEGSKDSLILINEKGEKRANLDFLTLPNKCFFAEPKIYCAVPLEIPKDTILPDDYLKRAVYFKDFLYQIDINQNSLSDIFSASEPVIDAVRLFISGNQLLFINRYDDRLYSLEL